MKKWSDEAFSKRAKKENYLARSIYKLEEIDRREKLFKNVRSVIDLGASPGSWLQYSLKKAPNAELYAVDLKPLQMSHSRIQFFQEDIREVDWETILGGKNADLVLSDMAPNTCGDHDLDSARSLELCELALSVAKQHLSKRGTFVSKMLMGSSFEEFLSQCKSTFAKVKTFRPTSTRKQSTEIFFIARELVLSKEG